MNLVDAKLQIAELGLKPAKEIDPAALADATKIVAEHYLEVRRVRSKRGVDGAPDWLGFETDIWQLSEEIREFLLSRRDLRGSNAFMDVIAEFACDRRYKKGRQNFILVLGSYGDGSYADELASQLNDTDVAGHVVEALTRMKATGYTEAVRNVLESTKYGWIKTAAKRYIATFAQQH